MTGKQTDPKNSRLEIWDAAARSTPRYPRDPFPVHWGAEGQRRRRSRGVGSLAYFQYDAKLDIHMKMRIYSPERTTASQSRTPPTQSSRGGRRAVHFESGAAKGGLRGDCFPNVSNQITIPSIKRGIGTRCT